MVDPSNLGRRHCGFWRRFVAEYFTPEFDIADALIQGTATFRRRSATDGRFFGCVVSALLSEKQNGKPPIGIGEVLYR